ncbi:MAG: hypothetical protein U5K77_01235 [Candidatus Saccharibacteria bacterium]|nr:hypothetical protein [Candidatus Saccharibacteria bacterium]
MKRGRKPQGYTIIETMIFLTVSSVLFVSAAGMMAGRQARAEFQYGIQEFNVQLRDIMNDVSTGYYEYREGARCVVASGSLPTITQTAEGRQGQNPDCIFIGRVIQFHPNDTDWPAAEMYRTFSVAGRRQIDGRDVQNLSEASTIPLTPYNNATLAAPDLTSDTLIPSGVSVVWVRSGGAGGDPIGAVGFFTDFAQQGQSGSGGAEGGARNVDLLPIEGSQLGQDKMAMANAIVQDSATSSVNPEGGVAVCLESGGGNNHAIITIGSKGSPYTELSIQGGDCPS